MWPWILDCSGYANASSPRSALPHANAASDKPGYEEHGGAHPHERKVGSGNRYATAGYLDDPEVLAQLMHYYSEDLRVLRYDVADVATDKRVVHEATKRLGRAGLDLRGERPMGADARARATGNFAMLVEAKAVQGTQCLWI